MDTKDTTTTTTNDTARVFVAKKNVIFDNNRKLVGRMSSSTMARRTARALNQYKPGEKGY